MDHNETWNFLTDRLKCQFEYRTQTLYSTACQSGRLLFDFAGIWVFEKRSQKENFMVRLIREF